MTEISPKMVDGEPICPGMGCYRCPECEYWVADGAGRLCVPALRKQRDDIKTKLDAEQVEFAAYRRIMSDTWLEQKNRAEAAEARLEEAEDVVSFYADPESYFAVLIMGDRPCGDFADDIDDNHSRPDMGPRPGKLAREYICKYYIPEKGKPND